MITNLGSEAAAQGFAIGDRVMALLRGPFGSSARITWQCVSHVPEGMAFEDAASMLTAYTTAYVGLVDVARLWQGQSVLINGFTDSVGQAAIMLAKDYLGAEVYVTVGSQEEREFVAREYNLPADRIFDDASSSIKSDILTATGGRGVSVVLNSLTGPSLQTGFDVLAPFGHFVEVGKRDAQDNSLLEMSTFSRVASFTSVDILALARERPSEASRVINEVARLAAQNVIRPINPITVFPIGQISKAMRLVQSEKHLGKVVLSVSREADDQVKVLPRVPKPKLRADASYLIVGGVGGLGRPSAFYLAANGAKNIIVLSRSAGTLSPTSSFVTGLRALGCRVVAVSCDVSNPADLTRALDHCTTHEGLPPIRGVIQGATVLRDSVLENLTLADWQTSIAPKVTATWNLHHYFSQPNSLDFFVVFSSLSGIFGWASQGNYAAGGTFQDALALYRTARNLPAVSLDIGWVKGVGASESKIVSDGLGKSGQSLALSDEDVIRALGTAILHPFDQPQVLVGLNSGPGPQWDVGSNNSPMGRDARFMPLRYRPPIGAKGSQSQNGGAEGDVKPLSALLKEAGTVEEARTVAVDAIAMKLADIFMREREDIDLGMSPSSLGVDSLVAVELRNMLMLKAGADVPMLNVLQSGSLTALAADVVARSTHVTAKA